MNPIHISTSINSDISTVWEYYNDPQYIMQWNQASEDWHCPAAQSEFQVGGKFVFTMASKDGAHAFDFSGTYTNIDPQKYLEYKLDDDRMVKVNFINKGTQVEIQMSFEPEAEHPLEMQKIGWQSIL